MLKIERFQEARPYSENFFLNILFSSIPRLDRSLVFICDIFVLQVAIVRLYHSFSDVYQIIAVLNLIYILLW